MNRSTLIVVGLLSIVAVAAVGYAVFANIFCDTTPPVIDNLTWEPTRVLNDKVYNATISFTATDLDSIIANAAVRFIPKNYSHLSSNAFPNDTMRE